MNFCLTFFLIYVKKRLFTLAFLIEKERE